MPQFTLLQNRYATDQETYDVLSSIAPAALKSGDGSAVAAVMALGLMGGRIHAVCPLCEKETETHTDVDTKFFHRCSSCQHTFR